MRGIHLQERCRAREFREGFGSHSDGRWDAQPALSHTGAGNKSGIYDFLQKFNVERRDEATVRGGVPSVRPPGARPFGGAADTRKEDVTTKFRQHH